MLLIDAANLSDTLRHRYREGLKQPRKKAFVFWKMTEAIKAALVNNSNDYEVLMDIHFPKHSRYVERFTTVQHIRKNICEELGISPIVWDEVLGGKPIVPNLAEESPIEGGTSLKVKEALILLHDIESKNILKIAAKMNEVEARLFWARALGEKPCIPVDKFLQIASNAIGEGKSIRYIRQLLNVMTPYEVLALIKGTDPRLKQMEERMDCIQPGVPFDGTMFPAWTSATIPSGVYLDIVKGQRRYLHITEFPKGKYRGVLYGRNKKAIKKIPEEELPFKPDQEYVFEVEINDEDKFRITDILSVGTDWKFHKQSYSERLGYGKLLSLDVDIAEPYILEEGSAIAHVFDKLQDNERARLIKGESFALGAEGGWMIMQKEFHLHLLLTGVKRNRDYNIVVKLSVMDGFEPFVVYEDIIADGLANHLRDRLAREGVMAGTQWLPVDEYAVMFVVEVRKTDGFSLTEAEILHIDSNMGISDTSQLTDLIELSN